MFFKQYQKVISLLGLFKNHNIQIYSSIQNFVRWFFSKVWISRPCDITLDFKLYCPQMRNYFPQYTYTITNNKTKHLVPLSVVYCLEF